MKLWGRILPLLILVFPVIKKMRVTKNIMFQVPMLTFEISEKQKIELLDILSTITLTETHEEVMSVYTSYYDLYSKTEEYNKICNLISKVLKPEFDCVRSDVGDPNLELVESWYQKYDKNHQHQIHNHGAVGLSFICYLKYNSKLHSATRFLCPFNNFFNGENMFYTPNVSEGSLIVFPSVLCHFAPQNTSETERIILSGNLRHVG